MIDPDENSAAYRKAYKHYLKSSQTAPTSTWSAFRAEEKFYKTRFPRPRLDNVLDLTQIQGEAVDETLVRAGWTHGSCHPSTVKEIPAFGKARAFVIPEIPGLVVLPRFFNEQEQRTLIISCVKDHPRHPNESNLDAHYDIPHDGLWEAWKSDRQPSASHHAQEGPPPGQLIYPKMPLSTNPPSGASAPSQKRKLVDNAASSVDMLPQLFTVPKPPPQASSTLRPIPASRLLFKMRWANLGRSYHWGTKSYDFSKELAPFPTDVREICQRAVGAVPWEQVWRGGVEELVPAKEWGNEGVNWPSWRNEYEPDAGIINFYQNSDTLMGHVDRSELSSTTPLVSISLGLSAVFLIGGLTRDTKPLPILLRSGDVIIMSGPRCRRAYHGVPRILEGTLPPHLGPSITSAVREAASRIDSNELSITPEDWSPFAAYMATTRINVNVRQVFPKGFVPPEGVVAISAGT